MELPDPLKLVDYGVMLAILAWVGRIFEKRLLRAHDMLEARTKTILDRQVKLAQLIQAEARATREVVRRPTHWQDKTPLFDIDENAFDDASNRVEEGGTDDNSRD